MTQRDREALTALRNHYVLQCYPSAAVNVWEYIWALDNVLGDFEGRRMPKDFNGGFTTYEGAPTERLA